MTDLRTALESAFSEDEASNTPVDSVPNTPEPVSTDKPLETTAEQRARDEAGRFAAKETPPVEPIEEPKPIKAPSSWKPAAQDLDSEVAPTLVTKPEQTHVSQGLCNKVS